VGGASGGFGNKGSNTQYNDQNTGEQVQRRKQKVFTPVTLKMVMEAAPRPDDACEFDGDILNDVSKKAITFELDHHRWTCN
jgi:activator of HSP90 ATPase